ncbi:hypothetical protein DSUL_90089 [Desulfovibrionales bacterium]
MAKLLRLKRLNNVFEPWPGSVFVVPGRRVAYAFCRYMQY